MDTNYATDFEITEDMDNIIGINQLEDDSDDFDYDFDYDPNEMYYALHNEQ